MYIQCPVYRKHAVIIILIFNEILMSSPDRVKPRFTVHVRSSMGHPYEE